MFGRIIVPLDGSGFAERALESAVEIAERLGASLTLVRAYEGPERSAGLLASISAPAALPAVVDPATVDAITRAAQEEGAAAHRYVDERIAALEGRGLRADGVVSDAPPVEAIMAAVEGATDALVVMSSHGRGGVERLVFGSVAQEVLRRCPVPVLLMRGAGPALSSSSAGRAGLRVSLGDAVEGTDGRLGVVHRLLADAGSDRVTEIVVRHGAVFGNERTVPLRYITGGADGVVQLGIDTATFETLSRWAPEGLRAPLTDYVGPPPADLEGTYRGNAALDQAVAMGPMLAHGKVLGYPGGEQLTPDEVEHPALARGMDIVAADGQKVGEVQELTFDAGDGRPARLVLRRGFLVHHDAELPIGWVQELSEHAVVLNVTRAEVEELVRQR